MPSWSLPDAVPARASVPDSGRSPELSDEPTVEMPALVWAPLEPERPQDTDAPDDSTLDQVVAVEGLDEVVAEEEPANEMAGEDLSSASPSDPEAVADATPNLPPAPPPSAAEVEASEVAAGRRAPTGIFGEEDMDESVVEAQSERGDTIPVLVVVPPEVLAYQAEAEQQMGEASSWATGGWHVALSPAASPEVSGYPEEWAFQTGAVTADEPEAEPERVAVAAESAEGTEIVSVGGVEETRQLEAEADPQNDPGDTVTEALVENDEDRTPEAEHLVRTDDGDAPGADLPTGVISEDPEAEPEALEKTHLEESDSQPVKTAPETVDTPMQAPEADAESESVSDTDASTEPEATVTAAPVVTPSTSAAQARPQFTKPTDRPRSVLVTGASRGIGRAVAQAMLDAGERVVGLSRSGEAPEGALGLAADVTDEASINDAVAKAEVENGPIEVLVACAGIARDSLAARTSDAIWESMLETDLTGVFRTVRAVLPQMMRARSGRIILISSVVASRGGVGQVAYGAAKAGVEGMVRSLARELAPRGITVNAVAPGFVATDMTNSLPSVVCEALVAATPIGRMATTQEVAAPVAFLASPQASYITGAVLPVDGGLGMGR